MKIKKIYASSIAKLTSNVYTGGGDDDTAAIQAVLDEARDENIIFGVFGGIILPR